MPRLYVPFRYGPTNFLHMTPQSPISDDSATQRCARRRMTEACQPFEFHRSNDEYETFFLSLKLPSPAITRVKGKMYRKNSPQRRRASGMDHQNLGHRLGQLGLTGA